MNRKQLRTWCKAHGGTMDRSGGGTHDVVIQGSRLLINYDPDHDPIAWARIEVPKARFRISLVGQLRAPSIQELETFIAQLLALRGAWSDPDVAGDVPNMRTEQQEADQ